MSTLIYIILAIFFLSVGYFLGKQVGYLSGKAEVSNIPRGESPMKLEGAVTPEMIEKIFVDIADTK